MYFNLIISVIVSEKDHIQDLYHHKGKEGRAHKEIEQENSHILIANQDHLEIRNSEIPVEEMPDQDLSQDQDQMVVIILEIQDQMEEDVVLLNHSKERDKVDQIQMIILKVNKRIQYPEKINLTIIIPNIIIKEMKTIMNIYNRTRE